MYEVLSSPYPLRLYFDKAVGQDRTYHRAREKNRENFEVYDD